MVMFDGVKGDPRKEMKVECKEGWNYVEFSPDGSLFLVGINENKELLVFEAAGFKRKEQWARKECKYINRARWIGNNKIIAGYGDPGDLLVYELGQKKPVLQIAPNSGSEIRDIDISQDGQYAFCGSYGDDLVFKVGIRENAPVQWKHKGHSNMVISVRLSGNQRHVLSGGNDNKAVLASSEDGSILASFSFSNCVNGVIWCPGDRRALVCSYGELVLLSLGEDDRSLERLSGVDCSELGLGYLSGVNASFGTEAGKAGNHQAFVVIGSENGSLCRVDLH
jgi:WD40 repeat protein